MIRILTSMPFQLLFALVVVGLSIYQDLAQGSWLNFQRSGSALVVIGAILSYRSIVRLGAEGLGSSRVKLLTGKLVSTDDSGPTQKVKFQYDEESLSRIFQEKMDNFSGYLGACFLLFGTVIWGYGDVLLSL